MVLLIAVIVGIIAWRADMRRLARVIFAAVVILIVVPLVIGPVWSVSADEVQYSVTKP